MEDLEEQSALATARARGAELGEKLGREQGEKIGREQGEKIGLEQGKKENQIEIAKKLKSRNMPISEIIELTGLSKKEIESLDIK